MSSARSADDLSTLIPSERSEDAVTQAAQEKYETRSVDGPRGQGVAMMKLDDVVEGIMHAPKNDAGRQWAMEQVLTLRMKEQNQGELLRFIERECRHVSVNNGWGQRHARGLADKILDAMHDVAVRASRQPKSHDCHQFANADGVCDHCGCIDPTYPGATPEAQA